jgi:hypothetical protein
MPFSSILSRHMMDSVAKYRPYIFEGDHWTDQEKERIARFLAPNVPERVYPNFNEWHFFKDAADRFLVLRVTYEKGSYYRSLDGVIGELMDDYGGSNFMVYLDPAAPVVYRYSRFGQDEALETTDLQAAIAWRCTWTTATSRMPAASTRRPAASRSSPLWKKYWNL